MHHDVDYSSFILKSCTESESCVKSALGICPEPLLKLSDGGWVQENLDGPSNEDAIKLNAEAYIVVCPHLNSSNV